MFFYPQVNQFVFPKNTKLKENYQSLLKMEIFVIY